MKPRIKDVNIHYARIKGNTQTKHENDLRRKVENLCQEINARPSLLPLYYRLKNEWCDMKRDQVHARVKQERINEFQNHDKGTKDFFQRLAQNRKHTSITAIYKPQGQLHTNKDEILHETQRFFQSLYQSRPAQPEAQVTFLQLVDQRLDPAECDRSQKKN